MTRHPHTIALIEDDEILRNNISDLISASPDWHLVASYPAAEPALAVMTRECPEVVLIDIQLPGMSGIECAAKLKQIHPATQMMMVTVYDNSDRIFNALAAGACGYLLKRDIPDKLVESLAEILAGGSPMSCAIARKVVQHFQVHPLSKNEAHNLTTREKQILDQLVKGALYKEIASDLNIGVETVSSHCSNIYAKLQVRNRTEAVVKYLSP